MSTKARWHHQLHPLVSKSSERNGLPDFLRHRIHPTHATLYYLKDHPDAGPDGKELRWSSRSHRKNRLKSTSPKSGKRRRAGQWFQGLLHMARIEYWNISWWVATMFTWGSVVWVINGFIVFLPLVNKNIAPSSAGAGWSAWVGAAIFELGSILGVLEAWNRTDVADFGWAVEHAWEELEGKSMEADSAKTTDHRPPHKWIWFSTDGKYFHELGFLAAFVQFWAATIFWICGYTGLPGILDAIGTRTGLLDGVFWTPQVVGGSGFIISSLLIMIEVQARWYIPAPAALGWHVGMWNFIGAVGFTLCGAFGYAAATKSGANYQSCLSTFWGGWAFLIGSVIQWYEAVNSIQ
ncbi:hypothetical protein FISHEDRAFT_65014 [Fistulina hepatica ATCC 64428]|uniref:Integral membrane protein n=1 Tax=Fistulina hepatica ATCC 64428 TaxID=1128425 RepID=A0A0D7AF43_9AGAR|nr:hypothetical protein FISHEDRAFT_65014 [Fistulina hepatica ATCC 64428]